jgi:hypothetical protein
VAEGHPGERSLKKHGAFPLLPLHRCRFSQRRSMHISTAFATCRRHRDVSVALSCVRTDRSVLKKAKVRAALRHADVDAVWAVACMWWLGMLSYRLVCCLTIDGAVWWFREPDVGRISAAAEGTKRCVSITTSLIHCHSPFVCSRPCLSPSVSYQLRGLSVLCCAAVCWVACA